MRGSVCRSGESMLDDGFYDDYSSEKYAWMDNTPSKKKKTVVRSRGKTVRTYKHRVLTITFPQTEAEWRKASKKRRSIAQKNAIRSRTGGWSYADPFGLTPKQHRETEYWLSQERKKESRKMGVEDMRAVLKDDHWEEVCGHSRWKWDKQSTIKEYNRYLREHRFMN